MIKRFDVIAVWLWLAISMDLAPAEEPAPPLEKAAQRAYGALKRRDVPPGDAQGRPDRL